MVPEGLVECVAVVAAAAAVVAEEAGEAALVVVVDAISIKVVKAAIAAGVAISGPTMVTTGATTEATAEAGTTPLAAGVMVAAAAAEIKEVGMDPTMVDHQVATNGGAQQATAVVTGIAADLLAAMATIAVLWETVMTNKAMVVAP